MAEAEPDPPYSPEIACYITVRLAHLDIIEKLLQDDYDHSNTRYCFLTDEERDVLAFILQSKTPLLKAARDQQKREEEDEDGEDDR